MGWLSCHYVCSSASYLVFSILRKAPTVDKRTTMCARPVQASVTVIVGHEKVRNSSKDSKKMPHERSYLRKMFDLSDYPRTTSLLNCLPWYVMQLKIAHIRRINL